MSKTGDMLRAGWSKTAFVSKDDHLTKEAFVPGPAGGDPAASGMAGGGAPMDPAMGGMAGAMPPEMAGGAGGMPPMPPGAPMDPAMMGAPPMDPAMAGGMPPPPMDPSMMAPPPPPEEGIPSGPDAAAEADGETSVPMSDVIELLGAVTGKRAPSAETGAPDPQADLAAAAGAPGADTAAPDAAAAAAGAVPQTQPITPLGGIDPTALG